jgi:putative ABC transport system permease protein
MGDSAIRLPRQRISIGRMILLRANLRYLFQHPLQFFLALSGIGLGVAVVIAIDIANNSARQAFHLSAEVLTGRATHQIIGGPTGLPEQVYVKLRLWTKVHDCAPVVEGYANLSGRRGSALTVLGVDIFADVSLRSHVAEQRIKGDVLQLLVKPGAGLISRYLAQQLKVKIGDNIDLTIDGVNRKLYIVGLMQAADKVNRQAMENTVIVDIATAQQWFGMIGRLSRIDLVLPDNANKTVLKNQIEKLLPAGAELISANTRTKTMEQMTRAFQINLTALSLLALMVGMFLIYNTMTFSVIQRRAFFGTLRAIGVTRIQIFNYIAVESLLIGLAATIIGLVLGLALGNGLLKLVTRTINDLYFVLNVTSLNLSLFSVAKGFILGIGATFFSALMPAIEAMRTPPSTLISRSAIESRVKKFLPRVLVIGVFMLISGVLILLLSTQSLVFSFSGLFLFVIGFAFCAPLLLILFVRLSIPLIGHVLGLLGRMSARSIVASFSRTGVATVALSIAVSTTIGVGIMIGSFRTSVIHWLENRLQADIYLSIPHSQGTTSITQSMVAAISAIPGVKSVSARHRVLIESGTGSTEVFVLQGTAGFTGYKIIHGDRASAESKFYHSDSVLISEPYAFHHHLKPGDRVYVRTYHGKHGFEVLGVYRDYGSDQGVITMSRRTYNRYWDDPAISALGIYLDKGVDPEQIMQAIRTTIGQGQQFLIRSNRTLLNASIEIFDRTFAITAVLRMLAIVVAFIGILSAFMAIQMERARELAVLRAIGLTPKQVWGLVSIETGLMGMIAGMLAIPLGLIMAWLLVEVINHRSFGWSMDFVVEPTILLQALLLALFAALLAGVYPALRMAQTPPANALREE